MEKLRRAAESRPPVDLLLADDETLGEEQIGDFLGELRGTPGLQNCKFFFLASPENSISAVERMRLGVNHCFSKPVCQSALLGAINDHLVGANHCKSVAAVLPKRAEPPPQAFGKARVLLAEDNRINQRVAQEILRQAGVECRAVENGRQVLEAVAGERFDLVLMDCQMPEMDGFTATQHIREMEGDGRLAGHLPVIALTANAVKGDRERCLAAGMDDYLSKPFEVQALLATMRRFLAGPKKTTADSSAVGPTRLPLRPEGPHPIDHNLLLDHCGNPQLARSLLSDFAEDLPKYFEQIVLHVREGDARAVSEEAHSLKGSAGILAAEALREIAAELEATGKAGDLAEIVLLVDRLGDEIRSCLNFIPEIQETMSFCEK